jgi:hypothetical protein
LFQVSFSSPRLQDFALYSVPPCVLMQAVIEPLLLPSA